MTSATDPGADARAAARSTLLFFCIVLAALAVGVGGAFVGWRLVRKPSLFERPPASIEALVRRALGDATDPAAAHATLMRLGFDQVGFADGRPEVWGVAHEGPGKFHLALRVVRVEVEIDEQGRVSRVSVAKGESGSP